MINYSTLWVLPFFFLVALSACTKEANPEQKNQSSFQTIYDFIIDANNIKYVATDAGLFTFDESTATYYQQNIDENFEAIQSLAINYAFTPGQLWLATEYGAYDMENQALTNASNSQLPVNNISYISFDSNQTIYYAQAEGVSIQNDKTWLQNPGKNNIYQFNTITGMGTASNGYTYVGTDGAGIERFKYDIDGISGATIFDSDWTKLNSNQINTVYIKDTLQAYGTPYGVSIHYSEFAKWDWETFTREDGLICDTVLAICQDLEKNWWFGTSKGISKFDGLTWFSFTKASDELLSDTVKFMAIDADGKIWIATDYGLSKFTDNTWTNFKK
jgi:ligand-binding sensor domain-containing protein